MEMFLKAGCQPLLKKTPFSECYKVETGGFETVNLVED